MLFFIIAIESLGADSDRNPEIHNDIEPNLSVTKPNILLISIDTTRSDHCSINGYHRDTTPHLKKHFQEGVRFTHAYAPASQTGPSHSTMFTSLYPISHGVTRNGYVLNDKHMTIAELLYQEDYQTVAFISAFPIHSKFGLAQGFTIYDENFHKKTSQSKIQEWAGKKVDEGFDRLAEYTSNQAIDWLEHQRNPKQPFFMFVHYFDPHQPYSPPKSFIKDFKINGWFASKVEKDIRNYDGEIACADFHLNRLLNTLKELSIEDNTIVVVTSDHGEGLMQHGHMGHIIDVYEEAVHVPLVFRWPGKFSQGLVIDEPVELVDLLPTLFDLIGLPRDGLPFQGKSLSAALRGKEKLDPERPVFFQRLNLKPGRKVHGIYVEGPQFGIRMGPWKYIETPEQNKFELFNLLSDPGETNNVFAEHPRQVSQLKISLNNWKNTHKPSTPAKQSIAPDDLEKLKSLGYVQ
ncbi:MAG: sulfatase [Sedimentisphaerales bacterium]|nr:sulfatase [Sedimentisphaerales bacterium]